jgi:LPPG:FO 2-phospho-L-lactate transferase
MLKKIGLDTWFRIGDRDFATHIFRTDLLRQGSTLSKVTEEICQRMRLKVNIVPMTDDKFETWIRIEKGLVHFEEYFVKRQAKDKVLGVEYVGAANAKPAPKAIDSILDAEMIVICPSNPIVSIGAILSVDGIRDALRKTSAKIVGISPIVAGAPIKGPADKLLRGLGLEVSAFSIAKLYEDFLDTFVIDIKDADEKGLIEKLRIDVKVTDTVMNRLEDKVRLAKAVLES